MSSSSQTEKVKAGRAPAACLECQRRKQKCSRQWPCNHCQSRKVPHLCQFKKTAPESESPSGSATATGKRKQASYQSDAFLVAPDPDQALSDGLAQLGYMTGHDFFNLAKPGVGFATSRSPEIVNVQADEVETALKVILPKPYTDVLVQNFLENANYHYYAIFPEQLRDQSAQWWETRAARRRLSPELTCLLIRVCAVSAQYLEGSLRQRLEYELGEKAQSLTERFHAAAQRLSVAIPRGSGGVIQVQQLFQEASWWKSEANMVEAWHSLSLAIREAQEIGMHRHAENLPDFEREIRKRLWCILWTWDWQMSTLLSRPLLIDQDDHKLEIPDGRLENITEPGVPHPLSSIALQASLGLSVSHLFQKLSATPTPSTPLVVEIESALEHWMDTFPPALRDHHPDTRWDQSHPNVPFMRCQANAVAYAYLLTPLKPYLRGDDPALLATAIGTSLRAKAVDTCLDLMKAVERFADLIFPASIKYFYVIFFMFDAATMLCSALAHDVNGALPKRSQCLRSLRTAQELMDAVAHLSASARISAQLLRKLAATLPLSAADKGILEVGGIEGGGKGKEKTVVSDESVAAVTAGRGGLECTAVAAGGQAAGVPGAMDGAVQPYDAIVYAENSGYAAPMGPAADWTGFVDYGGTAAAVGGGMARGHGGDENLGLAAAPPASSSSLLPVVVGLGTMQPGDPLTGTYLDQVWDWDRLNLDLTGAQFGL